MNLKDIGLGVLDRYTVITVIIVLALANTLFGVSVPIDTSNATRAFFGLVFFTGYIYLAHTVYLLPAVFIKSWIVLEGGWVLFEPFKSGGLKSWCDAWEWISGLGSLVLFFPVFFFLTLINFTDPAFDQQYPSDHLEAVKERFGLILGTLNRMGIVLIVVGATLPAFQRYVQISGVIGVILMLVIFLFKGNFSAIVQDGLVKIPETLSSKTKNVQDVESSSLEAKPSKDEEKSLLGCLVCGRNIARNGSGYRPDFCSLECRQKWFISWDNDWCVGHGEEREILNQLRNNGYDDFFEESDAIENLRKIGSVEALWALLAMVRDNHGSYYVDKNILDAITSIIKEKPKFVLDLFAVLSDKNEAVVYSALKVLNATHRIMYKYINDSNQKPVERIHKALTHDDLYIRNAAVELFVKIGDQKAIPAYFISKQSEFSKNGVIKSLQRVGKKAIPYLEVALRDPNKRVRLAALSALEALGVDAREPDEVDEIWPCPKCKKQFVVRYPKEHVIWGLHKDNLGRKIFCKSRVRTKCTSCQTKFVLYLEPVR